MPQLTASASKIRFFMFDDRLEIYSPLYDYRKHKATPS